MSLYSYKENYPSKLPERFRFENGLTSTSLESLSNEELSLIGFVGPIEIPTYNDKTQEIFWDGTNFNILELSDDQINAVRLRDLDEQKKILIRNLNWDNLRFSLKQTSFFNKIRNISSTDGKILILYNEFLEDFYKDFDRIKTLEKYAKIFLLMIDFDELEKESLRDVLSGYGVLEIIGDINTVEVEDGVFIEVKTNPFDFMFNKETLENIKYSFYHKELIFIPYKSWNIGNNGTAVPPIKYPNDGNSYIWDEELYDGGLSGWKLLDI